MLSTPPPCDNRPANMTTPSRSSATTIAMLVMATVATLLFLRFARSLLFPIALAVLLGYTLEPLVAALQRVRLPRVLAAALVMLGVLGSIVLAGYAVRDEARQLIRAVPRA